jgi:hypothetical protein
MNGCAIVNALLRDLADFAFFAVYVVGSRDLVLSHFNTQLSVTGGF